MYDKGIAVAVLATALSLGVVAGYFVWGGAGEKSVSNGIVYLPGEKIIKSDTVVVTKVQFIEKVKPVFRVETVELIKEREVINNKVDSNYSASVDTIMFDSTLSLKVKYNSPVPLDRRSYFEINAKIKERKIMEKEIIYIEKEEGFFKKWLHFGITLSAGYNPIEQKTGIIIGLGIMVGL